MSRFQKLFPHAASIIFDLGGVILNVDYQRTQKAFEALGITDFSDLYSQVKQTGLFDQLETGKISPALFRKNIRLFKPDLALSDTEIDNAWNAMLLDLPQERLSLLEKLKTTYRTFLLSNTNVIHLAALSAYLKKSFGRVSLDPYFEKAYYSSGIGLRKPHAAAYFHVINDNHLLPHDTVFIDDLSQNIEGAQQTGLQTYHLTNGETLTDLFL